MRAIAVMTVLVAHCLPASSPQQAAGHYAVLVFFVHTALVLLCSLERQAGAPGLARRFYIQRAFRIYPLSVLCVVVSLAFRISWPEHVFTPPSTLSVAANLLLMQNLLHNPRSISVPLWSLPYEVQMYAVLPLVFWFIRKRGVLAAVSLAAISVALPVAETLAPPIPGRVVTLFVPCFIGGALAYCGYGSRLRLPWWLWPVVIAAFGVIYWGTGQNIYCEWLGCIALGLLVPVFQQSPNRVITKSAAVVARYSFGIYVSHAPLLWLCFQRLSGLSVVARWLLFATLICTTPVALYHLVEEPMIRVGKALSYRLFPLRQLHSERECLLGVESSPSEWSGRAQSVGREGRTYDQ